MKNVEFPKEVADKLEYYVYRLIDPRNGETFYVGKGKGNRLFQHVTAAIHSSDGDEASDKISTIHAIHLAGLDVLHVVHRHGMDEQTAFAVEAALIDAYPGVTNVVSGTGSNDYGPANAVEIIRRYSAPMVDFKHRCLLINVNKTSAEIGLYNAVRFAWKLDKTKAEKAELILATVQGVVVGVFVAKAWMSATADNFPEFGRTIDGRIGFVGEEATSEIKELYVSHRIPDELRKKGAANPCKYAY